VGKLDHAMQLLCRGVISRHALIEAAAVISSTVFDFDIVFAAITVTFLAVVDQQNSCTPICRFRLIAVVT